MSTKTYYYGIRLREFYGGKVDPRPIAFVKRKNPTDTEPPSIISNTRVIEVHEVTKPYPEVEEMAKQLCRSYSSQEFSRNSEEGSPKNGSKCYYYGVRLEDTPPRPKPFVIRKKATDQNPPDAIVVYESTKPQSELIGIAHNLWLDYKEHRLQLILEERVPQEQELSSPGDVQVGDVVVHSDNEGHHFAIILDIPDEVSAWALFFGSKVYGKASRKATKEELALAGFVSTKTTYLNLVYRHVLDFYKHGISFPDHRVQNLRKEFLQNLSVAESQYRD